LEKEKVKIDDPPTVTTLPSLKYKKGSFASAGLLQEDIFKGLQQWRPYTNSQ